MREVAVALVLPAVACIIVAIVGGRAGVLGLDIRRLLPPVIRVVLGGFGVVLLASTVVLVSVADDDGESTVRPPSPTSDTTQTKPPTSEDSSTMTPDAESPEGQQSTGTGTIAHCRSVSVSVEEVVRSEGRLHVPISVTNDADNVSIQLPPVEDVHLIDGEGQALSIDQFGNFGWGIGPEVRPGSTFSESVVFQDAPDRRSNFGSVEITDIRDADDPFVECSVKVEGVTLP